VGCNLAGAKEGEKIFDFAYDRRYVLINSESCGWWGGIYSVNILLLEKKNIRSIKTIFLVGPRAQAVPIRFYQTPRKNKKQRPNNF
jgi:hypothetical protein